MATDAAPSFVLLPDLEPGEGARVIGGEEGRYLARVVRVRAGERVRATDGRGRVAVLRIDAVEPELRATIERVETHVRAATLEVWCGAPEGGRADWLVEKLAELGVATFVPVQFARAGWERAAARLERWERLAVAALRQSRSAHLLAVRPAATPEQALAGLGATAARRVCVPEGPHGPDPAFGTAGHSVAVVGPSSGFEAGELKWLESCGFVPLRLGASRLRTETAALAAAVRWAAAAPPDPAPAAEGGA